MKLIRLVAVLGSAATLHAAILPILHLDDKSIRVFDDYVAQFEKEFVTPFTDSGRLWIDYSACCLRNGAPTGLKPAMEARKNEDIAGGSIHHYSGAIRVPKGTIEELRRIMQDYPNYPKYFKPDVTKGSGKIEPDSTPNDEHYTSFLTLTETTLWINVEFNCAYSTHYKRLDQTRWYSKSVSEDIKELRDPKRPQDGTFPEGEDHGFLWRTNTYWFARQTKDGGLDLEADSITLSRPNMTGFAWWGAKRSHDAVEKILRDTKVAIEALH